MYNIESLNILQKNASDKATVFIQQNTADKGVAYWFFLYKVWSDCLEFWVINRTKAPAEEKNVSVKLTVRKQKYISEPLFSRLLHVLDMWILSGADD